MAILIKRFVTSAVVLAGFALPAQGSVIGVTNTVTFADQGTLAPQTISSFNLNGGNTVVALVSLEMVGGTLSATYGGVAANAQVTVNQGAQRASAFYWIGVPSGQDLVVTPSGSAGSFDTLGITALGLSNVLGVSDTDTDTDTTGIQVDLFYDGEARGLAVAAFMDNTFGPGNPFIVGSTTDHLDTVTQALAGNFDGGSAGLLHAYGDIPTTGTGFRATIQQGSSSDREAAALVAFTAVPEPSSLAIFAISMGSITGMLALVRRRRKA